MSTVKNKTIAPPIKVTDTALMELRAIMSKQDIPENHGLRIGVKGGGCSGFSYILGFDMEKEKDDIYYIDDLKVLIEKAHGLYLAGMEIDWVEGLNNRGFSFNNPNATDTCGCGSSFSA